MSGFYFDTFGSAIKETSESSIDVLVMLVEFVDLMLVEFLWGLYI